MVIFNDVLYSIDESLVRFSVVADKFPGEYEPDKLIS